MTTFKAFDEAWTSEEIGEYLDLYGILVLFHIDPFLTANVTVYGHNLDAYQKEIHELINNYFAGATINKSLGKKINEFAIKWYNKHVLKKKARVVNFKRS